LPTRTSRTCPSLNSSSANAVISCSFSFSSKRASLPLKSKRLAISLLAVSTAFLSSTALAWQVMSNEGMDRSLQGRTMILTDVEFADLGHHPPIPARRREGRHRLLRGARHQCRPRVDARKGCDP